MTTSAIHSLARAAVPLAIAALAGCTTLATRPGAADAPAAPAGTSAAPGLAIAGFGDGLRCMDNLLLVHGVRDLVVGADGLADPAGAGADRKDLLVGAVTDMTRRSRAVRVMAYGQDAAAAPQVLRGAIQRPGEAGVAVELTLLSARDRTVVPGVASRNRAELTRDGRARIGKYGQVLELPAGEPDAAVRALVELSSIELFGRLAKVPYWSCLGVTDAHPDVAAEIHDWYDAMVARPAEIIEYFQRRLHRRGIYDGPVDGVVNDAFKEAVAVQRETLGLSREPKLGVDFLQAYLRADHAAAKAAPRPAAAPAVAAAPPALPAAPVPAPAAPAPIATAPAAPPATAPAAPPAVPPAPVATAPRLSLHLAVVNSGARFAPGQKVELSLRPSRDAHVYCFLQDEHRAISRFFPNRFHADSRVAAAKGLALPGAMGFEIRMNPRGVDETVSCFATEREVLARLPASLRGGDFAPLPVGTLEQLRDAFVQASGGALVQEEFRLRAGR